MNSVSFNSLKESYFIPGDLICARLTSPQKVPQPLIDKVIYLFQYYISVFLKRPTKCAQIVHVSVVVRVDNGRVFIAEAMPSRKGANSIRVVDLLTHHSCILASNTPFEYDVFRGCDSSSIARIALQHANYVRYLFSETTQSDSKHKYQFCFSKAINAIVNLSPKRRNIYQQIFKQLARMFLLREGIIEKRKSKVFCSYFIARSLREAAIDKIFNTLLDLPGVKDGLEQIKQEKLPFKRTRAIRAWANRMGNDHKQTVDRLIQENPYLGLNPNYLSPQTLASKLEEGNGYHHAFTIVPSNQNGTKQAHAFL